VIEVSPLLSFTTDVFFTIVLLHLRQRREKFLFSFSILVEDTLILI